jgi:hypothetical protein
LILVADQRGCSRRMRQTSQAVKTVVCEARRDAVGRAAAGEPIRDVIAAREVLIGTVGNEVATCVSGV